MTTIKLNNYYPHLTECITLEVSEEIMELAEDHAALYVAIDRLPPVQARRVYARFILGRSVTAIARAEGVNKCQITRSIDFGLKNLREILKISR